MLPSSPILILVHILITLIFSLIIISRRINVSTTLSWIIVLSVLPGMGLVLYFLFGSNSRGRKRDKAGASIRNYYQKHFGIGKHRVEREDLPVAEYLQDLSWMLSIQTGFFPTHGNRYTLFTQSPPLITAMVEDIDAATKSVYLEFYIVYPKGSIITVLEALERAALRGIDTRLMVDDIGGRPFFKSKWEKRLIKAGVEIVHSLAVNPIKAFSKRTDLRNHRKLIVIDQTIGYTGSYNLTDPVKFKQGKGFGEWVDVMVRLEGRIVSSLSCVFNTDYIYDSEGLDYTKHALAALSDDVGEFPDYEDGVVMQMVPSGPELQQSVIHELIAASIFGARHSVTIVTPYFVPDETIQLALINAAHRGLQVRLIVPKRVDSLMARHAGESTFDSLIGAGIAVYRFTDGMLHTKLVQIDDELTLIGTANVDIRSFYLNLEMTLCVYDKDFAIKANALVDRYIQRSETLDPDAWRSRGAVLRWKENILRLASPLL